MQKVAEEAPQYYQFLVESANEIRKSPFRDEIADEMNGIIKTAESSTEKLAANFGSIASGIGGAAKSMMSHPAPLFIASTIAGGVALSLAGDLYDAARRGLTKSRHWSAMLEANPDLATRSKEDPNVQVMFNTLHRFNPEFSGDPHVAASFVKAQLEYPDDIGIPQNIVKAHNEIRSSGGLRPLPGMPLKTPADLQEQQLRMQGQQSQNATSKAMAFKTRQDAQKAYNERMGMGSAEQMDQLRRRAK